MKLKYKDSNILDNWEVKSIGDIGDVAMCKRVFSYQTTSSGEVPFYKIGTFGKRADAFISKKLYEEYKRKFNFPQKGDVLISASGTIGRLVVYDGHPAYFQDSNIIWLSHNEKDILNNYLKYLYQNIKWEIEGTTISRLYNDNFKKIIIIYPKEQKEQQAIVNVLSDIDNLIKLLKNLIDKNKAIKQGVMQELLTGRRRLFGFNGEWVEENLNKVVDITKGSSLSSKEFQYGDVPVVAGGKNYAGMHNKANRPKYTITISASGANAGFVKIHKRDIFATDCSTIEPASDYNIFFIYYNLLRMQNEIYQLQTGGAQPHIYPSHLNKLTIKHPLDVKEQDAIVSVLSDMDNEIEKLEQKMQKYEKIKQGMMQQLLTGRIRLINDEGKCN